MFILKTLITIITFNNFEISFNTKLPEKLSLIINQNSFNSQTAVHHSDKACLLKPRDRCDAQSTCVCVGCTCVALFLRWWHGKDLEACLLLLRQRCLSQWTGTQGSNDQLEPDLKQKLIFITIWPLYMILIQFLTLFFSLHPGVVVFFLLTMLWAFWSWPSSHSLVSPSEKLVHFHYVGHNFNILSLY